MFAQYNDKSIAHLSYAKNIDNHKFSEIKYFLNSHVEYYVKNFSHRPLPDYVILYLHYVASWSEVTW